MSETFELKKLIQSMGALLVLNTQVSMDGSIERKKDNVLCKQRGVVKAINELQELEKENAALREFKEKVNKELRLWNIEECSFASSFRGMDNIENIMLEGE